MFRVVSLHFTRRCNFKCSFCYREKGEEIMDKELFFGLPNYLRKITEQVALGGGEPTLYPDLVREFAQECKRNHLICNVTTNGYALKDWKQEDIKDFCEDITMISFSLDREKIRYWESFDEYLYVIRKVGKHIQTGCNLLIDEEMFSGATFIRLVERLFKEGVDRVYSLYPKNSYFVDILPYKNYYLFLSTIYPEFYVDDLTYKILTEERYISWQTPCHYGKDIISINEKGEVSGCSFSSECKLKIKRPEDILKIKDVVFEKRYFCPYLKIGGDVF